MSLQNLSKQVLIAETQNLIIKEKEYSDLILKYMSEICRRRLYAEMGFESLYKMLVQYFHLSETSAYNRVKAMRLVDEVPEAREALEQNKMNLSTLTQAQVFFHTQEKAKNKKMTAEDKAKVIQLITGKSQAQVRSELAQISPSTTLFKESVKHLSEKNSLVSLVLSKETLEKIELIKSLQAHQNTNPSMGDLIGLMAELCLETLTRKKGFLKPHQSKAKSQPLQEALPCSKNLQGDAMTAQVHEAIERQKVKKLEFPKAIELGTKPCVKKMTRTLSVHVKRKVYERAEGACEFISRDGHSCKNKFMLEFDHIHPKALGGTNDLSNIQLLCRSHNDFRRWQTYGEIKKER